jgi:hypothetical protein
MAKGYFKRISNTPYPVRLDLSGPVTVVQPEEVIFAEVATFKDVIGFVFVGWNPPQPPSISTDPLHPSKVQGYSEIGMVAVQGVRQAPHKVFLENHKSEREKEKVTEIRCYEAEEVKPIPAPLKTTENKENDKQALVDYLSKFDNKKWFVMKKEDARTYLDRLDIDFSNLPNSKNEFIKLLKDYIKSVA